MPDPVPRGAVSGATAAYGATLFVTSAGALVVEIVAGRILAPYVGMSLYTWTAIIAAVLAGLSAGHWLGGALASAQPRRAHALLAGTLILAAITVLASLVLVRLLSPLLLGGGMDPVLSIVLLASGLFFAPSLFVGVLAPMLTKLALDHSPGDAGRVLGRMFALGALGSIAGTLAAGYLFIAWIGSTGTMVCVATVYVLLGLGFAIAGRGGRTVTAASTAFLVVGTGGWLALLLAITRAGWLAGACTVESSYYCIRVIDTSLEVGRDSAVMVIDHMGHGINDRVDPGRLHVDYVALTDGLLRARGSPGDAPWRAYFIGGGAYTLPRAWAPAFPRGRFTVAEVDPAVTQAARERMWFAASPNVDVVHVDARVGLRAAPRGPTFHVVVGDAFHDISVPPHLVSVEFAREVAARLAPAGFYAMTAIDDASRPRFALALVRTLSRVFPVVEVWLDAAHAAWGGRATFLVLAAFRPTPKGVLRDRGPASPQAPPRTWRRWAAASLAEAVQASGVPLLTDDYAPVDRLMLPVLRQDL